MGERGNICMVQEDCNKIYFYTHWRGDEVNKITKSALIRGKKRWDNESYLARIVFNEMTKGEEMEETGFGISTYECDNSYPIPFICSAKKTVTIGNNIYTFEDFIKGDY
jgi:hypothetical protein